MKKALAICCLVLGFSACIFDSDDTDTQNNFTDFEEEKSFYEDVSARMRRPVFPDAFSDFDWDFDFDSIINSQNSTTHATADDSFLPEIGDTLYEDENTVIILDTITDKDLDFEYMKARLHVSVEGDIEESIAQTHLLQGKSLLTGSFMVTVELATEEPGVSDPLVESYKFSGTEEFVLEETQFVDSVYFDAEADLSGEEIVLSQEHLRYLYLEPEQGREDSSVYDITSRSDNAISGDGNFYSNRIDSTFSCTFEIQKNHDTVYKRTTTVTMDVPLENHPDGDTEATLTITYGVDNALYKRNAVLKTATGEILFEYQWYAEEE
ncbi:MAG: hypothetical protein ACQEQ4_03945 [Fibrobacterota bacterium]